MSILGLNKTAPLRAVYFTGKDDPLTVGPLTKPRPTKDQVLVRIRNAALNHRDLWTRQEQPAPAGGPVILGSDGSGVVEAVGEEVDPLLMGMEVIINPGMDWGNNPAVPASTFKILGFPDHGTFSDYLVIARKHIFEKPEHLSFEEAAALPLAGLTAYRALFSKARLRKGEKVLITGIGGGVALMALQFSLAFDARVFVTSGSPAKIEKAKSLGAKGGFNYNDADWPAQAARECGGFDIVIDSAGGDQFKHLVELAVPGGRIVNLGRTAGNIREIITRSFYSKQLSMFGTMMGTRDEFLSMLELVEGRQIRPVIDRVFPLEEVNEAFARMEARDQFGKIILAVS